MYVYTKEKGGRNLPFQVPPRGIEPRPSEPESEVLSFKLQGLIDLYLCKDRHFIEKHSIQLIYNLYFCRISVVRCGCNINYN